MTRRLALNVNFGPSSPDRELWRATERKAEYLFSGDYHRDVARIAESGGFENVFFSDVPGLWIPPAANFAEGLDPGVAAAKVFDASSRIGVIITLSTTYNHPIDAAHRLATLQWLGDGRLSWNAVTTVQEAPLANFGATSIPPRRERYALADQFIDVVDRELPRLLGRLGTSPAGRSNLEPPALYQAGGSDEGIDLAARRADSVFNSVLVKSYARSYVGRVRAGTQAAGRPAESVRVLPGLAVHLGSTDAEAQSRFASANGADLGELIELFSGLFSADLTRFDPERPLTDEDLRQIREQSESKTTIGFRESFLAALDEHDRRLDTTIRAVGAGHRRVVGSPATVADFIEEWFADEAADGFNLSFPRLPGDLEWFTQEVSPLLRQRGLLPS